MKIDASLLKPLPLTALLGSAETLEILNVSPAPGIVSVTAVAVTVTNVAGTVATYAATKTPTGWAVTVPDGVLATAGTVIGGVLVAATGKDENETQRVWKVALVDLIVLNADGTAVPGVTRYALQWFDAAPASPSKGNVCDFSGTLKVYDGASWRALGGGGSITLDDTVTQQSANGVKSSGIWSWVTGLLNALTLPWTAITGKPTAFTPSAHASAHASTGTDPITPASIGALANSGGEIVQGHRSLVWWGSPDYLKIGDDIGVASFEFELGTPSFICNSGDWSCIRRKNGVQTETLQSVLDAKEASGTAASAVAAHDANATAHATRFASKADTITCGSGESAQSITVSDGTADLSQLFTSDNTSLTGLLPYPTNTAGTILDRNINVVSAASVTVPDNFTDLLIRAAVASGGSLAVTMPSAITTVYGDAFPAEGGEWLVTITKTGAAEAYVRSLKMEVANA